MKEDASQKFSKLSGSILDLDKIRCYFKEKRVTNPLEPLSHQGFFVLGIIL